MFSFVVLGLLSSVLAKRLAGKNISEMTHYVKWDVINLKSNLEVLFSDCVQFGPK